MKLVTRTTTSQTMNDLVEYFCEEHWSWSVGGFSLFRSRNQRKEWFGFSACSTSLYQCWKAPAETPKCPIYPIFAIAILKQMLSSSDNKRKQKFTLHWIAITPCLLTIILHPKSFLSQTLSPISDRQKENDHCNQCDIEKQLRNYAFRNSSFVTPQHSSSIDDLLRAFDRSRAALIQVCVYICQIWLQKAWNLS